ncbi:MAG: tetratricopeptide repeat protein [Bacteroidota bacterium]
MSKQKKKSFAVPAHEAKKKFGYTSLLIVVILAGIFIYLSYARPHIQDDSYITFRYVKNFINGDGLTFNAGEHVEGFSSLLWVLILSFTTLLGYEIVSTAQLLGVLFGALVVILLLPFSKLIFRNMNNDDEKINPVFTIIPTSMLAFNGAFQYWAISGMETTLFVLLITAALYFYFSQKNDRHFFLSSFLFMLSSLARPEANLVFAIVLIHLFINSTKINTGEKVVKKIFSKKNIFFSIIYLLPNLVYLIFRLIYYGYLLPNTFYAKTGLSIEYIATGIDYTIDFMKTYMLWGLIYLAPVYLIFKKKLKGDLLLLFIIILSYTSYVIFVGGDVLPIYRFFLPVLPFLFLIFALVIYQIFNITAQNGSPIIKIYLPMLIFIAVVSFNYFMPKDTIEKFAFFEDNLVAKMSSTGRWLHDYQNYHNKKLTVAASTIGALSYYSDATVVDMLGLTDETVAHNPKPIDQISESATGWKERKYNADYILSQKPDFIYFSTGIKPSAFAERALFAKENFMNEYYPFYFEAIHGYTETIYKRNDNLSGENSYIRFDANSKFSLKYIDLYVQSINLKMNSDKYDELINLCEQMIEIGPANFSEPYRMLATIYANQRNDSLALRYITKLLELNPYDVIAHQALYKYYMANNNTAEAKIHYDAMLKLNPEYLSTTMYRQ